MIVNDDKAKILMSMDFLRIQFRSVNFQNSSNLLEMILMEIQIYLLTFD